jgi:hypothetical protein
MKKSVKINLQTGIVTLNDGRKKTLDNYILELEDRLEKIQQELEEYEDVVPTTEYLIDGEKLFKVLDLVEGK